MTKNSYKIEVWLMSDKITDWSESNVCGLVFGKFPISDITIDKDSLKVECRVPVEMCGKVLDYLDINPVVEGFREPVEDVIAEVNRIRETIR